MTDWMVSALRVAGLSRQLEKRALLTRVLARCGDETKQALAAPHGVKAHPGHVLLELNEAIVQEVGTEVLADINYDAMREAYGPVVRPMVLIALTLTGRSPGTLFSRIPTSLAQVLPGVKGTWSPGDAQHGQLEIVYPSPVAAHTGDAWRGALRFFAELSGMPARVEKLEHHGAVLTFHLAW